MVGVKKFLDEGVDVNEWEAKNARLGIYATTPLMAAAKYGHVEVAKLLLSRGADVNAADKPWGGTALGVASYNGHLEMVDFLISRGARVNVETDHGCTPWLIAVFRKHYDVAKLLVSKGATVPHAILRLGYGVALTGQVTQERDCEHGYYGYNEGRFVIFGPGTHDVTATYGSFQHTGPYSHQTTKGFPISLSLNLDKGYIYEMKPVLPGNSRWTVSIKSISRFTE